MKVYSDSYRLKTSSPICFLCGSIISQVSCTIRICSAVKGTTVFSMDTNGYTVIEFWTRCEFVQPISTQCSKIFQGLISIYTQTESLLFSSQLKLAAIYWATYSLRAELVKIQTDLVKLSWICKFLDETANQNWKTVLRICKVALEITSCLIVVDSCIFLSWCM